MTVLDVAGWAMTAAPYVPAAMALGALVGVVYAAHLTAGAWRERRARQKAQRIDQHPLVRRYHDQPDELTRELAQYQNEINLHDREEGRP